MGKLRVYCLKTLKKLSIYPLGNTPSAPSVLTDVAADNTALESGTLIRVQPMTSQLAVRHSAKSMNEVPPVQVLKPILIRVMDVGP